MASQAVDDNTYILIGSELSYFAAKIRAYLQWKGIPFRQTLASQQVYKEIIRPLTGANFIPVLLTPKSAQKNGASKALQDTRVMIRYLERAHPDLKSHAVFPKDDGLAFAAAWVELLADQWLTIQGRFWMGAAGVIEQQRNWIMTELGDTILGGTKASMEQKMSADQQAWTNFPQVLPNLGITDCTASAIRQQFHTILSLLNKHFAQNRFILGDRISLADFSLYAPFYVHLSRNPVPGFILKTEAPLVAEWIERVSGLGRAGSAHGAVVTPIISKSGDIQWVDEYPTAEDSSLPNSIIPFLELMMGDFIPQLAETCRQVYDFLDRRGGRQAKGCPEGWQELPRSVGWQEFFLRSGKEGLEAKGKRVASPHAVWMLQELVEEVYVGKENAGNEILKKIVGPVMVMGAWRRCVDYVTRESWVLERVDNRLVARPREAKKEARL